MGLVFGNREAVLIIDFGFGGDTTGLQSSECWEMHRAGTGCLSDGLTHNVNVEATESSKIHAHYVGFVVQVGEGIRGD